MDFPPELFATRIELSVAEDLLFKSFLDIVVAGMRESHYMLLDNSPNYLFVFQFHGHKLERAYALSGPREIREAFLNAQ